MTLFGTANKPDEIARKEIKVLKKILDNLKTGNYRIVSHEKCGCEFNDFGNLITAANKWKSDCHKVIKNCWRGNVLIMDNLAECRDKTLSIDREGLIAFYGRSNKIEVLVDADHDVQEKIAKAIKESDAYAQLVRRKRSFKSLRALLYIKASHTISSY